MTLQLHLSRKMWKSMLRRFLVYLYKNIRDDLILYHNYFFFFFLYLLLLPICTAFCSNYTYAVFVYSNGEYSLGSVSVSGRPFQSCQPVLMACLGLSAWQVRRPGQAEILSFGLACFGPETAVPGQPRPS